MALSVCALCAFTLIQAARITPSPTGVSTHLSMGFGACTFLDRTGVPCPSCGMTTSFAWFARGNLLASLYVQPMGTVLAVLTVFAFWISLYIAVTGRHVMRLLMMIPTRYWMMPFFTLAILGWGWKIFIHLRGADGW